MSYRFFSFVGGADGSWQIDRIQAVKGAPVESVPHLEIVPTLLPAPFPGSGWILRGVVSNQRYTTRSEQDQLAAKQEGLGRPQATCAALIPISKSATWWNLTQDERRAVFEERSQHTTKGLSYLPSIARRLHHSRDLEEPFDFLTWFEYAPEDANAFEELVGELRQTEEWTYVEREVDIRLSRVAAQ